MTKAQLLAMGLTEEQADKVLEGYKEHIPKERFNEVNNAKKDLEKQLAERDTQLDTLKKGAKDNEGLTKQIEDLQAENKRIKDESDAKVKEIEKDNLLVTALKEAKAKDPSIILSLLDKTKISVDNGNLIGFKEQLEPIQKGKDFLFDAVDPGKNNTPGFTGLNPGNGNTNPGQTNTGGGLKTGLANYFSKQNINN